VKVSAIVVALVLLVLAVPFLLVRMDVMDAEWLRFEPGATAIVVAAAIIVMALRRKRTVRKQGKKK
jgi:hypothetical protein